jgi:catechol-2,3-dioxygenase
MEAMISNLLRRFEQGRLSRRDLVQGLAMLAGSGAAASAQGQEQTHEAGLQGARIDHVSIQVSDLARSAAFYQSTFGFTVLSEDKPNEIVRLGAEKVLVSLHHKNPTRLVDHFAIGIQNFNRESVARILKARGINPEDNLDAGFHIKDPEGMSVQIVGA